MCVCMYVCMYLSIYVYIVSIVSMFTCMYVCRPYVSVYVKYTCICSSGQLIVWVILNKNTKLLYREVNVPVTPPPYIQVARIPGLIGGHGDFPRLSLCL